MEEQLITKETATLAKKRGFDEVTNIFFNDFCPEGEENINSTRHSDGDNSGFTSWPTQSLFQKWLRDKYGIFVVIEVDQTLEPKFVYNIVEYTNIGWNNTSYSDLYYTYEEALEAGLVHALKLIK